MVGRQEKAEPLRSKLMQTKTRAKSKVKTKVGSPQLSDRGALKMFKGSGSRAVTHYNCGVVDDARRAGVNLWIMRNGKKVIAPPKRVHRDITGVYGEHHGRADEGKYISVEGYTDQSYKVVKGAQWVNPFLAESARCNHTIVATLQKDAGIKALSALKADVKHSREMGHFLVWRGKRDFDGNLVASPWRTGAELWDLARKFNPALELFLRQSSSPQKGAKRHLSAKEKFIQNIEVLRRATVVIHVTTGEREFSGGATPYSKPLEQCGMAIDARYLTTGVDSDGNEIGEYHYRMVWGRPEPRPLLYREWLYEGGNSRYAFLNDAIRNLVKKQKTAA